MVIHDKVKMAQVYFVYCKKIVFGDRESSWNGDKKGGVETPPKLILKHTNEKNYNKVVG